MGTIDAFMEDEEIPPSKPLPPLPRPAKKPVVKNEFTPATINRFLAWLESLDPKDLSYRDQRIVIVMVKREHNQALVRHVLDLWAMFQAEMS